MAEIEKENVAAPNGVAPTGILAENSEKAANGHADENGKENQVSNLS